ncbi:TRAP transporter, DctM subunit [Alteribacillus persepolensis]|uniref:TRAP transporter, DctM subunit n=1 Tax=Alteribacillus persepolensis TaxID=568899 RepID=A0A1G8A6I8_9BACI|nr:TRAP transporter large permease [Alteribacillus persepolensis]SDH16564.1 TRAP transporter, DctM subunit [Alteribacillus persepolensis]
MILGFIAVFAVLLLIGLPIAYVLGVSTVFYIFQTDNLELLLSIPQRMTGGIQNYGLLAIPLFVLAGELMNKGGITTRLIRFAKDMVGHFRGGLAYVNVVTNMFLASIIGSANAQTAMMSRIMVPEMEKEGYNKEFSTALTSASSLLGPIIPPSLLFIIYGVTAEVSIGNMFIGGIIPGILLTIGFVILISFMAVKENFPKHNRVKVQELIKAFFVALPSLSIPFIIIFGILSGMFTPTESAAAASFLAMVIGGGLYKELKIKDFPKIFLNTAMYTSIVTFIIAMATIFGWVLSFEQVPQQLSEFMVSLTDNVYVFLFICIILFLLVGMVIEGMAAVIILVPILLPVAVNYGIDPIQFGIIMSINLAIGLITPPVGTVLFIASSITKVKFETLAKYVIPFVLVALIALLIIAYVPAVTTWLPSLWL